MKTQSKNRMNNPVQEYLKRLELEIKKLSGVVPEDALCDVREFLQSEFIALEKSEPGMGDAELLEHFVERFGKPEDVAYGYSEHPDQPKIGHAPNWRICCTRCGRSAPADRLPIVRMGAWSAHKYIAIFCHACRRLRWGRLIKDLDTPNLTKQLGADKTAEDLRRSMHRPWTTVLGILAIVVPLVLAAIFLVKLINGGAL